MQVACRPTLKERIAAQAGRRVRRPKGRTTYTVTGEVTNRYAQPGGTFRSHYGHYKVELRKPDGDLVYVPVGKFYGMVAA